MERFVCHKVVEAAKIEAVYIAGDVLPELFGSEPFAPSQVGGSLVKLKGDYRLYNLDAKHKPAIGGYFVRYADGYTSYSPAAPFEEGYSRVGSIIDPPFGVVERIAVACHEANRAYALATGEDPATVFPSWSEAPEAIRESARIGVRAALEGATPEQLHESWLATKAADGWVYGPVKDLQRKQHPC